MEQMKEQADKIELIRHKIEDADAIVIGAGAGLSTAAGFTYSGDRFEKYFQILGARMASPICIPVAFMITPRLRNIGRIGAAIFISTVIRMWRMAHIGIYMRW